MVLFVLASLFFVPACGPSRGTIKGTVRYKNTPVTSGQVCFWGADGHDYPAEIAADGTYEAKGVLYGELRVSVRQYPKDYQSPAEVRKAFKEKGLDMPVDYNYGPPKSQLPAKYADIELSGLTVTVSRAIIPFDIALVDD
jgi:hypothetical protein